MHPPSWEGGCQSFSEIMDEKMWTVMFSTHVMLRSFVSPAPEPMTLPEILVKSSSITPGWCNVTLECKAPGNREDLNVTWERKGLPRELEWSETVEQALKSWKLSVNMSLIQCSANLTCVVRGHVHKSTASVDFAQICCHGECNLPEGRGTPEFTCSGWELWAFLPTLLLAPPSTRVTRYRSLGSTANLLLLLNFSHIHALLSTLAIVGPDSSLSITLPTPFIIHFVFSVVLEKVNWIESTVSSEGFDLQCLPVWFRAQMLLCLCHSPHVFHTGLFN